MGGDGLVGWYGVGWEREEFIRGEKGREGKERKGLVREGKEGKERKGLGKKGICV